MWSALFLCLMTLFSTTSSLDDAVECQNYQLEVLVTDIKNDNGRVLLSVYDQAKGFPGESEYAVETYSASVNKGLAIFQFTLPAGEYALSVLHDENENNILDANFLGMPKEGIGVSKNPKSFMGPPKYDKSKFVLNDDMRLKIKMLYL